MKKVFSAVLSAAMAISSLAVPAYAEENITPSGISYENIGAEIESLAKENESLYASFGAAVFSGDEVLYSGHFGFIDRENQAAADENAVYEWGSISKMFVWVSAMQLYEQGKLDLNEDIRTYLPEDFLARLKYDRPITMMNLMNHNAGWQETTAALEVADEADIISLEDALKATEPAQVFSPGELAAVIVFAVVSVINLVILIVEGILRLAKKGGKMPAGRAIFAGQLAKLITALSVIAGLFTLGSGLSPVLCVISGICAIVCVVSVAFAVKAVITEKEMKLFTRVCYVVFSLCSLFVTGFIVYFELFSFRA